MKRLAFAFGIAALLGGGGGAHEIAKGPNGGPVVDSGGHHIEMVTDGAELVLILSDDADRPLASAGARSARAVVQDSGKMLNMQLVPREPNKLIGVLPQPLGKGARVVVSAVMPDGHALQARFVKD